MRLVERGRCFKKHSVDRTRYVLSLAEPKNIVSEFMYAKHAIRQFIVHNERVLLRSQGSAGGVRPLRSKQRYRKQRTNNGLGLMRAMWRSPSIERAPCRRANFAAVVVFIISGSGNTRVWLAPIYTVHLNRHVLR